MFEIVTNNRSGTGVSATIALLIWSAAPSAFAGETAGHVTASVDASLDGPVADGEHVKLGEDAGCSILLDEDAVVELCGETSVVFKRDPDSNRRIVSLDGGELRIVVEPREFEERIEIHTPAAIATLLGTIVHVAVDPETGETTISSAQSRVSVRSDEPGVSGTTVLTAGEQVTVDPGQAPPAEPKRLDPEEVDELGGCLVNFHLAAADRDGRQGGERVIDRLTAHDAANAGDLPRPPASDRPGGGPDNDPGDPLVGQEGVCVTTDCDPAYDEPDDPNRGFSLKSAN